MGEEVEDALDEGVAVQWTRPHGAGDVRLEAAVLAEFGGRGALGEGEFVHWVSFLAGHCFVAGQ